MTDAARLHGPTTIRRRLAMKLRSLRSEKQYSLDDVRNHMEWSLSKLIRIENGAVNISVNDLRCLLDFYGTVDAKTRETMLDMARLARQQQWTNEYREQVSQTYFNFLGYESDARRVKQFQPVVVPGLLRTADYARALTTGHSFQPRTADEVEARVSMCLQRQQRLFGRMSSPDVSMVIDESAIRRSIGGKSVMLGQVDHLINIHRQGFLQLAIIPLDVDHHPGVPGPFSLLEFDSPADPDVVVMASAPDDVALIDKPEWVASYRQRFQLLLDAGTNWQDTGGLLQKLRDDLRSSA